jgi:hypothetical protein
VLATLEDDSGPEGVDPGGLIGGLTDLLVEIATFPEGTVVHLDGGSHTFGE